MVLSRTHTVYNNSVYWFIMSERIRYFAVATQLFPHVASVWVHSLLLRERTNRDRNSEAANCLFQTFEFGKIARYLFIIFTGYRQ